ncbi:MAG: RluA family pseudouridine synthase [Fusicatenibacter sp.]|nr:RluA family pseudouridine synthase [Fusicatenibacter sp.]
MSHTLQHMISLEENGWTVEQVLLRSMGLTRREISRGKFSKDGICLNGIRCRTSETVSTGSRLSFRCSDDTKNEIQMPVISSPILYEDEDVIVTDKPSGAVCHPSHGHYFDSIAVQWEDDKSVGASLSLRCIGRLDKDTSGLLLLAKNRLSAARLSRQRESGVLQKEYTAIVHGNFEAEKEKLEDWICLPLRQETVRMQSENKNTGETILLTRMAIGIPGDGMTAKTHYQVLCQDQNYALVRFRLETGRMHQIRVHMAAIGHPLFGDPIYGTKMDGGYRAALHASRLCFDQPMTGERIEINSFRMHMFD